MKNKTIFSILTLYIISFTSIFASDVDILTKFRLHGIQEIEQDMNKELTKTDYWENFLSDKDTTFGYIESYDNVLTCNKQKSQLCIYVKDKNNSKYGLMKEYHAFTGKMQGDKTKEGDLKTPVGIYELVNKIEKVDPFYGPLAFVTSYPNLYDKYRDKTGQGIWIHGLPINQDRDEFTRGCIAINNNSIECIDKHIDISKTILLIDESQVRVEVPKKTLASILAQLYAWRYAWIYNNLDNYLEFYDDTFKRFDGMNKKEFTQYKSRVFAKQESKTIIFSKLNVLPYPDTEDIYKITFTEKYHSDSFRFNGDKTLIVKFTGQKLSIITEK